MNNDLYLYILVRTDMDSMQYGKGAAQAAHAANLFTYNEIISKHMSGNASSISKDVLDWQDQAGGFGTTITLGATEMEMQMCMQLAAGIGLKSGIVTDPTYPLMDGQTLHLLPVKTTAYIFGRKSHMPYLINKLPLLNNEK